jgi:hypothetical protein
MDRFFNLVPPAFYQADYTREAKLRISRCPFSDDHLASLRRLSNLDISLKSGKGDETMLWCLQHECLVHQSLIAEFERQGLTGFRVRPATIRFPDGRVSKDYKELVVVGCGGTATPESGVRLVEGCPGCQFVRYTNVTYWPALVDLKQWTGEDFFKVWPLPNFILVTKHVVSLLRSLRVKCYSARRLDELRGEWDFGIGVGPLSDVMPSDVARKYGRSLGLDRHVHSKIEAQGRKGQKRGKT